METSSFDLLGIRIHALSKRELVDCVSQAVDGRKRHIIGNHNLHSLYMWFHEPRMREFYSLTDYTHIDGMSLVLLGRMLGLPIKREHRTGYMDFLPLLTEEAVKHEWRIFYLGSRPEVAEKAARMLRNRYTGLQIAPITGTSMRNRPELKTKRSWPRSKPTPRTFSWSEWGCRGRKFGLWRIVKISPRAQFFAAAR